jgi:hypothetical protein
MVGPEIELLTFSTLPPAPACGIHRAELVAARRGTTEALVTA